MKLRIGVLLGILVTPLFADELAIQLAVRELQRLEGFRSHAYRDGGQWSYGYGTRAPSPMSTITQADALRLLEREVRDLNLHVTRLVRVQLTYQQKAALISFTYNVGRTGFAESTLLRRLNRGDFSGAASELAGWVYAGGKPILHSRRQAELALWFRY